MTAIRVLEPVVRRSPLALRIVDGATGRPVVDGIDVAAWPLQSPGAVTIGAAPTGAGIVGFRSLPGLRGYEDGSTDRDDWFDAPPVHRPVDVVVRVGDRLGRYLPVVRLVSVPRPAPIDVALPIDPSAPGPAGHALVVGQVLLDLGGEPAPWALLTATLGGGPPAHGLTDCRGAFALPVPLSSPPTTAAAGVVGPAWSLRLTARYRHDDQLWLPGTDPADPADPPAFDSILTQGDAAILDDGTARNALVRTISGAGPHVVATSTSPPPSVLYIRPVP